MVQDDDLASGRGPSAGTASRADALAASIAANAAKTDPDMARRAATLMEEQTRLLRLQSTNLLEQNQFELSHLRWRRFNDQMKGAMQIMLVVVGAVAVIALGAAIWNASQADGLVVEQFSVPPGFAAAGITGATVADDLTQKVEAISEIANGRSLSVSKGARNARDDEIRVEIPDTGISLAELWRYLRDWLGHERAVSGNIREEEGGRIALTVAMAGVPAFTLEGARTELSKLEQQAAERLFGTMDPINYVLFLAGAGRGNEALAAAAMGPSQMVTPIDRADAYTVWAYMTFRIQGDVHQALQRARIAIAIYPKLLVATRALMQLEVLLGHDEAVLTQANKFGQFHREDQPLNQQGSGFDQLLDAGEYEQVEMTGDFARGLTAVCRSCSWGDTALLRAEFLARLYDVRAARAAFAAALASDPSEQTLSGLARFYVDDAAGNWRDATNDIESYESNERAAKVVGPNYVALRIRTAAQPLLALALAGQGRFAAARALIDATPDDCTLCQTVRGDIEALAGDTRGAAVSFSRAVHDAPSIPFAYTDWGRMLLAQDDPDGAIAKLAAANAKSPHYADALELWGEALILKNRSDLALAKFEEANKYAPNWGRLHLEWGKSLWWCGDKDAARLQFQLASKPDLSSSDRQALERANTMH